MPDPAPVAAPPAAPTPPPKPPPSPGGPPTGLKPAPESTEERLKSVLSVLSKGVKQKETAEPKMKVTENPGVHAKKAEPKVEEKKEDEKPNEEPKAEEKANEEPKPEPKKAAKKEKPETDIADAIAKGFEKAAAKEKPEPKAVETPKVAATDELSVSDKRKLSTFEAMAKDDPKVATLPHEFKAFIKAEKEYIASWQKENPGKKFDARSDDHEEFYDQHEPQYDTDEYMETRARVIANETIDKKLEAQQKKADEKQRSATMEERAGSMASEAVSELAKAVGGEKATLKQLETDDPFVAREIKRAAGELDMLVKEGVRLFSPESTVKLDYQGNNVHKVLYDQVIKYEVEIQQLEPDDQMMPGQNGGKLQFAPLREFSEMSAAQQAKHWTLFLQPQAVKAMLVRDFGAMVNAEIESSEKAAEARIAKKTGQKTATAAPAGSNGKHPDPHPAKADITPPSITAGDRTVTPIQPPVPAGEDRFGPFERALKRG